MPYREKRSYLPSLPETVRQTRSSCRLRNDARSRIRPHEDGSDSGRNRRLPTGRSRRLVRFRRLLATAPAWARAVAMLITRGDVALQAPTMAPTTKTTRMTTAMTVTTTLRCLPVLLPAQPMQAEQLRRTKPSPAKTAMMTTTTMTFRYHPALRHLSPQVLPQLAVQLGTRSPSHDHLACPRPLLTLSLRDQTSKLPLPRRLLRSRDRRCPTDPRTLGSRLGPRRRARTCLTRSAQTAIRAARSSKVPAVLTGVQGTGSYLCRRREGCCHRPRLRRKADRLVLHPSLPFRAPHPPASPPPLPCQRLRLPPAPGPPFRRRRSYET